MSNARQPVVIDITSRWGSIGRMVAGKGGNIYSYQIAKCAQNMLTACLFQELKEMNIKVFAVHPERLKTSFAAPDADVAPEEAALKLMKWIAQIDDSHDCQFYDLMDGTIIEW